VTEAQIVALVLVVLVPFGAAASGQTEPAAAGEEARPVVALLHSLAFPPPEENFMIGYVSDLLGIDWRPTTVPSNQYREKLNAVIASGDLPDTFTWSEGTKVDEYADNGVIIALDDLLESQGKDILANKRFMMDRQATHNGEVFAIPNGWAVPALLAMREDWMDNLGLEVPTTLEDYFDVLHAFTYGDPDGNGKDDTIGIGMHMFWPKTMHHLFGAYGIAMERPHYVDGRVIPYFMHPDYLDAVRFLRRMHQAGVMEPDFATINFRAANEKLWNGIYGAYDFNPDGTTNNWLPRYKEDPKPRFVYTIVHGPDGEGGTVSAIYDGSGFSGVSSQSKNPEAAMRLLNFFNSEEGDELMYLGVEGRHFEWIDEEEGTLRYLPPFDDMNTHRADGAWGYSGINPRFNGIRVKTFNKVTREAFAMAQANFLEDAYIYERPQIEQELGTILDDLMKETLVSLVLTDGNIESEYQQFVDKYLKSGGRDWIEQATAIYKKEQGIR
jgi:putative aldouronate transport system substrate-binding protein